MASQNLKPGDVIFSEKPFAYGPKADTYPLCLGCYNAADGSVLCSSCGWPVCGPQCENNPAHRNAECAVFSKAGVKFQPVEDPTAVCLQYECITPLRWVIFKLQGIQYLFINNVPICNLGLHLFIILFLICRKDSRQWISFNKINILCHSSTYHL